MDTIFMNSENTKTSKPYVLILKLTDKIDLQRDKNSVALSSLGIYYTWKNIRCSNSSNTLKISVSKWNNKFKYQADYILYQIVKTIWVD